MHFDVRKSCDEMCRACQTLWRDMLVLKSATRTTHYRGCLWTEVDMSTSLFPEVVPEIDANPEHKRLNMYMRAQLVLRCPPCWNKHGSICLSWQDSIRCMCCRIETWCDKPSGIWAIPSHNAVWNALQLSCLHHLTKTNHSHFTCKNTHEEYCKAPPVQNDTK